MGLDQPRIGKYLKEQVQEAQMMGRLQDPVCRGLPALLLLPLQELQQPLQISVAGGLILLIEPGGELGHVYEGFGIGRIE